MKTITTKMKNCSARSKIQMQPDTAYLAKCMMIDDGYSLETYYIIEWSTVNQAHVIYNTGLEVWNITEISTEPFGVQND